MKKTRKRRFQDLINENKQELLNDPKELEKIEQRLDKRHQERLNDAL
ncbi:FbpB family small basic protein [Alteribacter populi]|nr:FbpB family small basic protein [Alteribacter populi]